LTFLSENYLCKIICWHSWCKFVEVYFFINVQSSECITYHFFSYIYLINCTFLSFSCLNCLTNESCMLVFISGFRSYAKILYNELLTATTMGNPKGCRNFLHYLWVCVAISRSVILTWVCNIVSAYKLLFLL